MKKRTKKGFVVLGASGGVATAFLHLVSEYRFLFGDIILVDKSDSILKSTTLRHETLKYTFYQTDIQGSEKKILRQIKNKHSISFVLDLTDCYTEPILAAADELKLSYLNCSLNTLDGSMNHYAEDLKKYTLAFKKCPHVLALGMNPGIINHLIIRGVIEHGAPAEFVEIEFESGEPKKLPEKPFITWSKKQFLNETVWDNAGYCSSGGEYIEEDSPAINNLVDTEKFVAPIVKMHKYPKGMIVSHDEVITMSRTLEIPGKFIYAIHPASLERILNLVRGGTKIKEEDVIFLDNVQTPLRGSDMIGVWLYYDNKSVCYYTNLLHSDVTGTNATLHLVAVGFLAGFIDFYINPLLDNGVLTSGDLDNETFLQIVQNHVDFKKIIINK